MGRSQNSLDDFAVTLSESISLDQELYQEDIRGSLAHARMLYKINVLNADELKQIEVGLEKIRSQIERGEFKFDPKLEDIHTHIEMALIEICGDTGRRLHTARSRNDQIALDTHLYVISRSKLLAALILALCEALYKQAQSHLNTLLPGYTHLQVAQPIRLSHHLLAYFWAFSRDMERLKETAKRASRLPLGSGALAGLNYKVDRDFLANELGFASIYSNSMDAVSSRDHILDFVSTTAVIMSHASRLAEEIILWNSQEFSFLVLADNLTTGSSIMPQKKNPDLAELVRGKTGRVQANLQNILTNLKGLPMCYNRDLQEDRFPLLDSYKQTSLCLEAMAKMIEGIDFKSKRMRQALEKGYANATDLADALVQKKAIPFREAHHLVGRLVQLCVEKDLSLEEASLADRKAISLHFANESFYKQSIDIEASVEKKLSYGGTSLSSQKKQIEEAALELQKWKTYEWS